MNKLKTYLLNRRLRAEERELREELEALEGTARKRRANAGSSDQFRDFYDGFKSVEKRRYNLLCWRHQVVCYDLGIESDFFNPKMHGHLAVGDDDNSPPVFTTVREDNSRKITFEYDYELGGYWQVVNGVRNDAVSTRPKRDPDTKQKILDANGELVLEKHYYGFQKANPPKENDEQD